MRKSVYITIYGLGWRWLWANENQSIYRLYNKINWNLFFITNKDQIEKKKMTIDQILKQKSHMKGFIITLIIAASVIQHIVL